MDDRRTAWPGLRRRRAAYAATGTRPRKGGGKRALMRRLPRGRSGGSAAAVWHEDEAVAARRVLPTPGIFTPVLGAQAPPQSPWLISSSMMHLHPFPSAPVAPRRPAPAPAARQAPRRPPSAGTRHRALTPESATSRAAQPAEGQTADARARSSAARSRFHRRLG